jgi:hypothetical protein
MCRPGLQGREARVYVKRVDRIERIGCATLSVHRTDGDFEKKLGWARTFSGLHTTEV